MNSYERSTPSSFTARSLVSPPPARNETLRTGYGSTGPYAKYPGYDVAIEAEAGLMHITGEKDGRPVKVSCKIPLPLAFPFPHPPRSVASPSVPQLSPDLSLAFPTPPSLPSPPNLPHAFPLPAACSFPDLPMVSPPLSLLSLLSLPLCPVSRLASPPSPCSTSTTLTVM